MEKINPYLSIVIPVFNEEKNLEELYRRLTLTLDRIGKSYEIIFTNDGSRDRSSEILYDLHVRKPDQIRVIEFGSNFGQHMAIMAAFERVRGEIVITLDADLQNPPEEIAKLIIAMEQGHDVVNTHRENRQDSWFRRMISKIHNKIRGWMIPKIKMIDEGCMLRAYRRHIVDLMASTGEANTFIPALALSYAAHPTEIPVAHEPRFAGKSNYNFFGLIRYNFDLVTGFSLFPLQIYTLLSLFVISISFLSIILLSVLRSPMIFHAMIFFVLGIFLFGLGIIGEYIGRIYLEVRKRPRFVIRKILEKN